MELNGNSLENDASNLFPTQVSELAFSTEDAGVFKIHDVKTKLSTLQNYFFPRLEMLIAESILQAHAAFNIDAREYCTFVYTPSHRKDAKTNYDFGIVNHGITPRRNIRRTLQVFREDQTAYKLHPSRLEVSIYPAGVLQISLTPMMFIPDLAFVKTIRNHLDKHEDFLARLFIDKKICYDYSKWLFSLGHTLEVAYRNRKPFRLRSFPCYFPATWERGLQELCCSFVGMFPIFDLIYKLAEGEASRLNHAEEHYRQWLNTAQSKQLLPKKQGDVQDLPSSDIQLPHLPNYQFIRAGVWWQILARDQWTCCSCGRSTKMHGIVLNVDHIIPRSKGGTDEIDNLQTLCEKSNFGKSNRDYTDLRKS